MVKHNEFTQKITMKVTDWLWWSRSKSPQVNFGKKKFIFQEPI